MNNLRRDLIEATAQDYEFWDKFRDGKEIELSHMFLRQHESSRYWPNLFRVCCTSFLEGRNERHRDHLAMAVILMSHNSSTIGGRNQDPFSRLSMYFNYNPLPSIIGATEAAMAEVAEDFEVHWAKEYFYANKSIPHIEIEYATYDGNTSLDRQLSIMASSLREVLICKLDLLSELETNQ